MRKVFDPLIALSVTTKRRTAFMARQELPELAEEPVLRLHGITKADAEKRRRKTKEGRGH